MSGGTTVALDLSVNSYLGLEVLLFLLLSFGDSNLNLLGLQSKISSRAPTKPGLPSEDMNLVSKMGHKYRA